MSFAQGFKVGICSGWCDMGWHIIINQLDTMQLLIWYDEFINAVFPVADVI